MRSPNPEELATESGSVRAGRRYGPRLRRAILPVLILVAASSWAVSWAVIRPLLTTDDLAHRAALDWRAPQWDALRSCSVTPEYDRTMKRVVISLAKEDSTLSLHHELLLRLPGYTQIIMLLERTNLSAIKTELHGQPYARRVQLIAYDGKPETDGRYYMLFPDQDKLVQIETGSGDRLSRQGSLWAQDLFEVITGPSGGLILLASEVHKYYYAAGNTPEMKVFRDNVFLARLASLGLEVQALPVTFMGGNILVDVTDGVGVAFCGGDVLRTTRTVARAVFDSEPADMQIIEFLKEVLNVESVVIVGGESPQPHQMFHLDQAMTLLPGRVAAVTRLVGEDTATLPKDVEIRQVRRFLTELESVLQTLGYRLIYMDTSVGNIMSCQHYVNAIPYVDALTGQRTILMPTFPSRQTEFEEGLVVRNTAVLESVGYEVVHVPTAANEARGGIHCLVNVLD